MVWSLMEGDTITTTNLISSIKNFGTDGRHDTIKTLIKNFILPDADMAIKQNQSDKIVYSIPVKPPLPMTERTKSINEAKIAFLNSTMTPSSVVPKKYAKKEEPTIHYAQIAVTTESDTRSEGGGKTLPSTISKMSLGMNAKIAPNIKKRIEQSPRKVSFKIKNASVSYKRPPLAAKTMTVTSNKVSELTQKFNNLQNESHIVLPRQSKIVKTIEEIQSVRCSASNSSTPSSTLSSSPNIKIVVRQRRGSKKRNSKKRCSSMDSIDTLFIANSSTKIRVIRSKSDGTKIPKTSKKRLKYQDSSEHQSGSDSVDGSPYNQQIEQIQKDDKPKEINSVKNVIKKFECEIIAQANSCNTLKKPQEKPKITPLKEKPKVPEKKSTLVVTKNLVVKDGVPKIKTIKPAIVEKIIASPIDTEVKKIQEPDTLKKKEPIYDRKRYNYKTNYIHTEKLPLKVVEIIPEDLNESMSVNETKIEKISAPINDLSDQTKHSNVTSITINSTDEEEIINKEVNAEITPNDSFLWRRKSTQIYSDSEKSSDSPYCFINITMNESTISSDAQREISISQTIINTESQNNSVKSVTNMDFESNLVEAYNKEILVGCTSKPKKEPVVEDDYEVLEPKDIDNVVIIPVKTLERTSKINCPLPEIPKEKSAVSSKSDDKENIYQCLLEMRSHPEGDESSLHNYESCDHELEERTRGDGDSDDGYEYCKSPIKPYCLTSSSGIQIAENYRPYAENTKNYAITKSGSGTSTISYEKIGPERIYEKIPSSRASKPKDSSPTYSSRHSIVSDCTSYNDTENIYDTIKHSDGTSLSHCYESIPNSPSMVKHRNNLKKQLNSAIQKRLSFDTMSNISQSTLSSEQKTNSLYGQRSVISFNGQEIAFQVPSSETSVSDRSDRSDDWVDVSDEEKNDEQKIIIVRERSRGRKSPISWSQKVRHQWQKQPKQEPNHQQECDSSDSGHLYESLEPPAQSQGPAVPPRPAPIPPIDDDFDSFDSDSETDIEKPSYAPPLPAWRLPPPPASGQHTLTKIASAAHRKMTQIKRNLTKRYSVAMDGKPSSKSSSTSQNGSSTYEANKVKKAPIYANTEKPVYSNITFNDTKSVLKKTENPLKNGFKEELKTVIGEKRLSSGDIPPPLPEKLPEKPVTPTGEKPDVKKDSGTLSRKAYFSFKSRFRRATSLAVDINAEVPSALKITNSTFYLTDSMDGDSGFSNCSDNGATVGGSGSGSAETLSPAGSSVRTGKRRQWAESSPCLALERPTVPPPPPPQIPATDLSAVNEELKRLLPTLSRKEKGVRTRTSWYADGGSDAPRPQATSNSSWYAEAGLAPAGHISSSSGASSGSHPASPLPHSLFTHEPLYQFYNAAKVESVYRESGDSDSDAYEPGSQAAQQALPELQPSETSSGQAASARPSAMALVAPRGPARTLWCEVPEVLNSAVLSSLAPAQKRLQEAKFELLTSEASYLNSLNVLETHFIAHPAFREPNILPRAEWETLFSTILPVRKCSQLLMNELEKCWQENILLQGICDIVREHAEKHFHVYVKYCENQALMVKALQRLRDRPAFAAALKKLESHPACQSLSLHSFLMLPMQRVTRLPLLMDAVLKNLTSEDGEYHPCMHALATLNNFVSQCNEGARNTERIEEMFRLSQIIEFPPNIKDPPCLGPASGRRDRRPVRWLVRSGEMTQLVWKTDELKLTFGKKFHKVPLHLFLFNDLLVISKKKSEDCYVAVDHCPRSLLEVCSSDGGAAAAKHALLLTLLENHEARTIEMLMSCPSETDASRWSEALSPVREGAAGEAVYAGWDCPQVVALYAYAPAQPDELPLAEGDVVNVTRKTTEGWFYGERTRDGEAGWFPGSYTAEIASPHVRARNLRQRYRLLALSSTYFGQKKKL